MQVGSFRGNMRRLLNILLFFLVAVSAEAKKHRPGRKRTRPSDIIPNQPPLNTDRYNLPVPFGHIFREGYEDPKDDVKYALDPLELNSMYLRDGPYARELITNKRPFQLISDGDYARRKSMILSEVSNTGKVPHRIPPDEYSFSDQDRTGNPRVMDKNDTIQRHWNFEAILKRNLAEPSQYRLGYGKSRALKEDQTASSPNIHLLPKNISELFDKGSFMLIEDRKKNSTNFTTCQEFGKRAKFHPNDIVNIDWVPFYIWSPDENGRIMVSRVHRFQFPTKKQVKYYKENFTPLLEKTVDWDQPKLLLKHTSMEWLMIAVDRTGLFDAIPFYELPPDPSGRLGVRMPVPSIRMKIVDPYLALMYCGHDYATMMAISGSEPRTFGECESEAALLKFKGVGFPVRRNAQQEAEEIRKKALAQARRDEDEFINVTD